MSCSTTAEVRTLCASYEAIPESVGQARRALGAFAETHGACEEDLQRIRLASSEALSNAVIHAYGAQGAGLLDLNAAWLDGELSVLIADQGCGLGGARQSEGLGLGLAVMTQLCDSLRVVTTSSGGTRVEMRFRLTARGPRRTGVSTRAVG
jgi:stage II sporulation protein AB (anti-sigma F factor)